jgi:hypothetical protein
MSLRAKSFRGRIHFIGTTADLQKLMEAVEAQKSLKYTLTGFPDEPTLHQWDSYTNIEGFGVSRLGKLVQDDMFLISEPGLEIKVEPAPQSKGGIKYDISTPLNPKTLCLSPGGTFGSAAVISGEVLKYSPEPEAEEMFKLFRREVRRQFNKHPSYPYWLGKEAAAKHAAGIRLTDDVNSLFSLPLD